MAYHLGLHKGQSIVHRSKKRFRVIVAGRRWGKTNFSKTLLIDAAARKRGQKVWYVAPTYQMARDIMWEDLKSTIPNEWMSKINETRMSIRLVNGSTITLKGADKPDTLRGVGLNFLVLDETQDMKKDVWELVLRPTLASTGGRAIFIGTPKSYNWFYDLYVLGQRGDFFKDQAGRSIRNEWESWQFPTIMSPFIPPSEILRARRDMDPRSFRQEFEASFETMSGRVYYPFDRNEHVGDYPFNPSLPIHIGQDFNIDPMSSVIMQEQPNGEIWVVDEIILPGSNTQETADEIARRYFRHINRISIYPDPAGSNRGHARGESDLDILREAGFKNIYYKPKHPAVSDRVNAVNRLLKTAEGTVRLRVNRNCSEFINSMEQTIYKEGSREVDKSKGTEHAADAFGYYADFRHPARGNKFFGISI